MACVLMTSVLANGVPTRNFRSIESHWDHRESSEVSDLTHFYYCMCTSSIVRVDETHSWPAMEQDLLYIPHLPFKE